MNKNLATLIILFSLSLVLAFLGEIAMKCNFVFFGGFLYVVAGCLFVIDFLFFIIKDIFR